MRDYYEKSYDNKMDNLEEMDKFTFSNYFKELQNNKHFQTRSTRPESPHTKTRKYHTRTHKYRPANITVNTDVKILNKILANQIQ